MFCGLLILSATIDSWPTERLPWLQTNWRDSVYEWFAFGIEDLLHKGQLPSPSYNHNTLKYNIKGMKVFVFVSCVHRIGGIAGCAVCMESV